MGICCEKLYQDVRPLNIVPIILHKILDLTNILKVVLDEAVVKQIKSATMVKVGFKYEDDTNFRVFPLSQVDLNYWKNQL